MTPTIGSLFSGIGGLELGIEHATGGMVRWQVEKDAWCREVLARHWPDAARYDDVRHVGDGLRRVDIICGGFPCQPVSVAGKRQARADDRWLWEEYQRIVAVVRPRFVVVENVPGLLTADKGWAFGDVLGALASLGYGATWDLFRGSDVASPQRRERCFLLAYDEGERCGPWGLPGGEAPPFALSAVGGGDGGGGPVADPVRLGAGQSVGVPGSAVPSVSFADGQGMADARRLGGKGGADGHARSGADRHPTRRNEGAGDDQRSGRDASSGVAQPGLVRVPHGVSARLDEHRWPAGRGQAQHEWEAPRTVKKAHQRPQRLKALGNAVIPQVASLAWRVLYARVPEEFKRGLA